MTTLSISIISSDVYTARYDQRDVGSEMISNHKMYSDESLRIYICCIVYIDLKINI